MKRLLPLILFFQLSTLAIYGQMVSGSDNTEQCVLNAGDEVTFDLSISTPNPTDFVSAGTVTLDFDFYHSWASDIEIILCAPDGVTCATIKTSGTNNSNDYGNVGGSDYDIPATYSFSDAGIENLDSGGYQPPGDYAPATSFSVFDGVAADGIWQLTFSDGANGDDGCIRNVLLNLTVEGVSICGSSWFDSGGSGNDYSDGENITTTFCPDVMGEVVSVNFSAFSCENNGTSCYDGLTIHNGNSDAAATIDPPTGGTIWCWDRDDATPTGSGDLQGMTITSTDATGCLTFVFTSDGSVTREGWEAAVSCAEPITCFAPTVLSAGSITSTSAELSWTTGGAALWEIVVQIAGSGEPSGAGISITDNPYTASGLTGSTDYEFYVRDDCGGGDLSDWSGPYTFTTPLGCGSNWFDSGGIGGSYSNSENITTTFCPDNPGEVVQVSFTSFSTENLGTSNCYDGLTIHNGDSDASPTIPSPGGAVDIWCWDMLDGSNNGTGNLAGLTIVSTDATGCLTFVFTSDNSVVRDGWEASIYCGPPTCPPSNIVAQAAGTVTSDAVCVTGDGWHHYYDSASDELILSLQLGNTGAQVPVNAVSLNASGTGVVNLGVNGCGAPYATSPDWFVMKRTWDVAPLLQPASDVNVRFYYTTDDFNDVSDALPIDVANHTDLTHYKVNGAAEEDITVPGNECHESVSSLDYQEFYATDYAYSVYETDSHFAEYMISSFSGGGGGGGTGAMGALPVELLHFTGKALTEMNVLQWATATEDNAQLFVVERSEDGESKWEAIMEVAAAGYTNYQQDYQAMDKYPVQKAYYRLRMIDFDGSYEYSAIIQIQRPYKDELAVYPIPAQQQVNVSFTTTLSGTAELLLHDLNGSVIQRQQVSTVPGIQTHVVDLQAVPNGVYMLLLEVNDQRLIKRIVKQ